MSKERSEEVHCGYCRCPVEYYSPFKAFDGDRGCEAYCAALDIVDDYPEMPYKDFHNEMLKIKDRFPEIKNYKELCEEFYDALFDCGVINQGR